MICFYFHILLSDNLDRVPIYQDDKTVKWLTTVKLGIKELLNKEQIGFKELFTDYQLFYIP